MAHRRNSHWDRRPLRVTLASDGEWRKAIKRTWIFALLAAGLAACAPKLSAPRDYTVFFETDRAELTDDAKKVVAQIATNVRDLGPAKVVVSGRADGGTAHDAALAETRAANVTRALIEAGVGSAKLERQADVPPADRTGVAAHQVIVRLLP